MTDEILLLKEVAVLLKVSEKTVYRLAQRGYIPCFKVGEHWRFRRCDLDEWINGRSKAKPGAPAASRAEATRALIAEMKEQCPPFEAVRSADVSPLLHTFGAYELDESCYQLRRAGRLVAVEPKVFALLVYLMRHRDRVVSKDELLTALWPGHVVSEYALTHCVTKARKAVADGQQKVIQTFYSRGYRFVAPVIVLATATITPARKQQTRVACPSPVDPEAYDSVLCGRAYYWHLTPDGQRRARQMYEKAITLAPHYAAAYASLGLSYWLEWGWCWSHDPQTLEHASALTREAVAQDKQLPLAHVALSLVALSKKHYAHAITAAEQSIALAPDEAWGYGTLAEVLTWTGHPHEALDVAERAMQLEPESAGYFAFSRGLAYRTLGRLEEAHAAMRRVVSRNPNHLPAQTFLTILSSETGHEEAARQELVRMRTLLPELSLDVLRQRIPYKDAAESERIVTALRRIGLR